jgi:type IV secretion system protein VirB2
MNTEKPKSRAALLLLAGVAVIATLAITAPAYAAGTGMPWEQPLQQVLDSLTGPVARAAAIVGIIISGMAILFSEGGGGIRKLAFVGLGIAVMFGAVSFFLNFFGFAGGATI